MVYEDWQFLLIIIIAIIISILFMLGFMKLLKYLMRTHNERKRKNKKMHEWKNAEKYWNRYINFYFLAGIIFSFSLGVVYSLTKINIVVFGIIVIGFLIIWIILIMTTQSEMHRGVDKYLKNYNLPEFMIDRNEYKKQRPNSYKLKKIIEKYIKKQKLDYSIEEYNNGYHYIDKIVFKFPKSKFSLEIKKVHLHYNDEFEFLIGKVSSDNTHIITKIMHDLNSILINPNILKDKI